MMHCFGRVKCTKSLSANHEYGSIFALWSGTGSELIFHLLNSLLVWQRTRPGLGGKTGPL